MTMEGFSLKKFPKKSSNGTLKICEFCCIFISISILKMASSHYPGMFKFYMKYIYLPHLNKIFVDFSIILLLFPLLLVNVTIPESLLLKHLKLSHNKNSAAS